MDVRALALEVGVRRGPLDVLLGVVPSPAGVGHGDGHLHARSHATCKRRATFAHKQKYKVKYTYLVYWVAV